MLRKKIYLALLGLVLAFGVSKVNAAPNQNIDLEQFKKNLREISAASPVVQQNYLKANVKTLDTKYLLSPGDSLALSVYGEPEFTQAEIIVRPDGYATIDPFGEFNVAGLSIDQFTQTLSEKFKSYLLNPKVSVKVNNLRSAKVYVYGAIEKPGLYEAGILAGTQGTPAKAVPYSSDITVANVISNAGGIKYNADLRNIKITNNTTGKNQTIDLMKLIENGDVGQDLILRSGDSVYVPSLESDAQISDKDFMLISSSSLAPSDFPVRVLGAVNRPGVHSLTSRSPLLNSAIASSEGYSIDADKKLVTVQRITPQGNTSTFYINPSKDDMVLRPNDIVIIADKSTSMAARGFDFAAGIVSPFVRFSDAYNGWAEMFDPDRRYRY